jgi:hypothetical protein
MSSVLPTCGCVSVDSPLSTTAGTLGIVTFAIAVAGGIAALIAFAKSWKSTPQEVLRLLEISKAAANEAELFRTFYATVPEFFPQSLSANEDETDARVIRRNQLIEASTAIFDQVSTATVGIDSALRVFEGRDVEEKGIMEKDVKGKRVIEKDVMEKDENIVNNDVENNNSKNQNFFEKMSYFKKLTWIARHRGLVEKMQRRTDLTPDLLLAQVGILAM